MAEMQADHFSNPELVTIAVALLGGDVDYADREDIAVKANGMAPGRFSWRKFPERIDLDAVGNALRDAKKARNGGLLVGGNAKGWMLSPAGLQWVKAVDLSALQGAQSTRHRTQSISANQEAECLRLRSTRAYALFVDSKPDAITLQDFFEFARVNEYFRTKARERRYAVIDNAVVADGALSELWALLKLRFMKEAP